MSFWGEGAVEGAKGTVSAITGVGGMTLTGCMSGRTAPVATSGRAGGSELARSPPRDDRDVALSGAGGTSCCCASSFSAAVSNASTIQSACMAITLSAAGSRLTIWR